MIPAGEVPRSGVPARIAREMTIAEQADWVGSFLRRHPVSRRSALKGGGAALAALAISTDPFARAVSRAYAADEVTVMGRRLAYGPDPRTSMRLSGELTGAPPAGRLVAEVGLDRSYGDRVDVEVRRLLSQIPSAGPVVTGAEQFFVHASVDGLTAGRTYHYRFRLPDGTVTPDATFTTAPARGTVAAPCHRRLGPARRDRGRPARRGRRRPALTTRAAAPAGRPCAGPG
mgnify:CR=1 FL=1